MSDHRPGDARLLVNGEPVRLRLTLGALAEIEDRLGGGDFSALATRLEKTGVGDLLILLEALTAGGGRRLSVDALSAAQIDLGEAARAAAKAFAALSSPSPALHGSGGRGEGASSRAPSPFDDPSPPAALPQARARGEEAP